MSIENKNVIFSEPSRWASCAATLIQGRVNDILRMNGECSILLTGGRSAKVLYEEWGSLPDFLAMKGVNFYLGDERCVGVDSPLSNYSMIKSALFKKNLDALRNFHGIDMSGLSFDEAAKSYADVLPEKIDILLLTVGDDGHIASLFPNDPSLLDHVNRVVTTIAPCEPKNRITITPLVITQARNIFVLAPGKNKAKIFQSLFQNGQDILRIPASMVLGALWLTSAELPSIDDA